MAYARTYLKVCPDVHSLQLCCVWVCDVEVPRCEQLVAEVHTLLLGELGVALIVGTSQSGREGGGGRGREGGGGRGREGGG